MKQYKDVTSRENSIYKLVRALSQKKVRENSGLFLIEGNRLVEEANSGGIKIKYLIINETAENVPKINQDCQVLRLSNNLFKKVSDTVSSQGIIAVAEQIEISLADIILGANPLVVVLNGLQDPGNLGTIIRTSAAAGATAVLLTEGTVDFYNPKVIRSTMGSLFQVPIVSGLDDNEAVKWLNYNSINIMVADLDSEEYYYSANLKDSFALVIGNENRGANDIWRKAAYKKIKIPILGSTESLNASVAAEIIKYADDIYLEFGADKTVYGTDEEEIDIIKKEASLAKMKLIPTRIRHLGTEKCVEILKKNEDYLRVKIDIKTDTKVKKILVEKGRAIGIETVKGEIIKGEYVVVTPGRAGSEWLKEQAEALGIKIANNPVDVGVRVEVPAVVMKRLTDAVYE